jgi:molybdopterin converting factor subunit 1
MRCEVLLFAGLAEAVGMRRLTVELERGATVSDALDALSRRHPPVAQARHALAVAINERYGAADAALREGDTIALIPPVSGG